MSMIAKAWWKSFSSCAMVVSTFYAFPLCVLFSILVSLVRALVLLAGGVAAVCVQALVLCFGAVVLKVYLCLLFLCLRLTFIDCSALGTDGVDIVRNWVFGCVVDIVLLVLLLLVYSSTLELVGLHVVVECLATIDVLCSIARSVIWISWFIS